MGTYGLHGTGDTVTCSGDGLGGLVKSRLLGVGSDLVGDLVGDGLASEKELVK